MSWKNFPIPETIVIPLLVGLIIDVFFSYPVFSPAIFWEILGTFLLLIGLVLMSWSVREAGKSDMESPDELITTGPYAFSRNPMYLSWMILYLAIFFLNHSLWLFLLFFIALWLTHFTAVLPEEQVLSARFGETYEAYCKNVRRYL